MASLTAIVYPAWVIQPFRAQDARQLSLALNAIRVAPLLTLVAVVIGIATLLWWRPRRVLSRLIAGAGVVVLILSAVVARVDYFEIMFRPDPNPRFLPVAQAPVDDDDMVMVARSGGEAHAYPIRFMAYHHLVNDVIAGEPVLATY